MLSKISALDVLILHGKMEIKNVELAIGQLKEIGAKNNCFIQIVPSEFILGEMQLIVALEHALSSFESRSNFTKSKNIEFLVRLSCQRQADRAIEQFGIMEGKGEYFVVVAGGKTKLKNILKLIEKNFEFKKNKKINLPPLKKLWEIYGIIPANTKSNSATAIKEFDKLVIEKIALLALEN